MNNTTLFNVRNVYMEITSRCNMKCLFCPYPVLNRPKQDMKDEHVVKIINEVKGNDVHLTFHVLGEPLLNKRFFDYARMCDDYNIKYWLVTNALSLDESAIESLFSLKGLKELEISFHTLSSDSFSRLRGCNASFDAYLEKIRQIIFSEKRFQSETSLNIDVMYDAHFGDVPAWNNFSFSAWQDLCSRFVRWGEELENNFPECRQRWPKFYNGKKKIFSRADMYLYRRYEDIPPRLFEELPPHITWLRWEFFPNMFLTLKKFFFFTKNDVYLKHAIPNRVARVMPASGFTCSLPQDLTILSNGAISFCCLDYEGELSCGNIQDMSLAEASRSAIRKRVQCAPDTFALCRQCFGKLLFDF